jgi:hypothetical protein
MDIKELLEEDSFDPKKLFDEEQYHTLVIDRDGFSNKQNNVADLIYVLLEQDSTREEKDVIYSKLKELNASAILLESLRTSEKTDEKIKLLAACWESGIDFSKELVYFAELVCHPNFELAVEALTVAENIETLSSDKVTEALQVLKNSKEGSADLKTALINHLSNLE